jgi:hypothetical protein
MLVNMDVLLIGPAIALTFAGTLFAGKAILSAFLSALEYRSRHERS